MKVELCDKRPVSISPNNEDPFIQTVCNRHLGLEPVKNKFKNISELRNARVLKQKIIILKVFATNHYVEQADLIFVTSITSSPSVNLFPLG